MITHKDFLPKIISKGRFFSVDKYETFEAVVDRVNKWLAEDKIEPISLETILFPNGDEESHGEAQLKASGDFATYWLQTVRVWYRAVEKKVEKAIEPCKSEPTEEKTPAENKEPVKAEQEGSAEKKAD